MKTGADERALLLDVDGVLVLPPERWSRVMQRRYPGQRFRLALWLFFQGQYQACIRGERDLDDILPRYLRFGGYSGHVEDFKREIFALEDFPNIALLEAVHELKAADWPVFLATNQERHRLKYLLDEMKFGEVVDGEYSSASVGHRKPHPAYFAQVAARLNLPPARIVFWDDAPENVAAARAAGWTAHLYESVEGFRQVMEVDSVQAS